MGKKNKIEIGIAGEFLVASKLSELGYAVGVTRKNTPGIDILVSDGKTAKMIQVKTTEGPDNVWVCPLDVPANKDRYFVFVNLNPKGNTAPTCHIVSSATVKAFLDKQLKDTNAEFEKKHGKAFTGAGVYKFKDPENTYHNKWNTLSLENVNAL